MQAALDALLKVKRRSTIVIAHRLVTVKGADKIVVLGEGRVVEKGTHEELIRIEGGHYRNLVQASASKNRQLIFGEFDLGGTRVGPSCA